jgi:D-glycero-D-manno-heptose 1,7-bisphosphate phosphatase
VTLAPRAAFLDRDGVINRDTGYVHHIAQFEWLDGVFEALRILSHQGFLLVVVTNQSGIARGYYGEQEFADLTDEMRRVLGDHGITIAHVAHCPHLPADLPGGHACDCRKPLPGMLTDSARRLGIDLGRSIMIGDKPSDMAAGRAAGVRRCILIGQDATDTLADAVFPDLRAAAAAIARDPDLAEAAP